MFGITQFFYSIAQQEIMKKESRLNNLKARKKELERDLSITTQTLHHLKCSLQKVNEELANKPKKLTVAELEQKLGYSIEIVSE